MLVADGRPDEAERIRKYKINEMYQHHTDDMHPCYLPDGGIAFASTRCEQGVLCDQGDSLAVNVLYRIDRDGRNLQRLSQGALSESTPSVANDGRILFTSWQHHGEHQGTAGVFALCCVNPDGTQVNTFWGNQSVWPDLLKDARSIPNSRRVMFTGSAHHNWFSGSVGIIDPQKGLNFPDGLTKVTADVRWPEVSDPPQDTPEAADYHASGRFTGYKTPYPLSDEDLLVSARGIGDKFRLYLMDVHGNRDLIYEGVHNVWHAIPVRPRPVPPQHADRVVLFAPCPVVPPFDGGGRETHLASAHRMRPGLRGQ